MAFDDAAAEVRQCAEEWMAAAFRFDIEAACSYLAPGFTMVTNRGSLIDAEQWRVNLSHRITAVSGGFLDSEVRVYGDIALMLSRWRMQATFDGKDWSDDTYITDVWVRHDDRWQIIRRHSTTVDPDAS
jgi:ketosteroid isomerase-like protein